MSFFRTAIYQKNVPAAERAVRIALAAAGGAAAWLFIPDPSLRLLATASAGVFSLTGFLGFCPMCYFAGRRLSSRAS